MARPRWTSGACLYTSAPAGDRSEAREVEFRRHRGESVKSEWSVVVIGGPDGAR